MRVFDFDGTIYDGESSVDFFKYTLRRHPKNFRYLPRVLYMLSRYKRLKVSSDELFCALERYGAEFLKTIGDISSEIRSFWDINEHKIKPFYLNDRRPDDVILSASPDFLINEAARRLGISTVIASKFDLERGKVIDLCYHTNKCERFRAVFPDAKIDEFYTDSENDKAVFELADKVFMVNGNTIKRRYNNEI